MHVVPATATDYRRPYYSQEMEHEHLMKVLDSWQEDDKIVYITEIVTGGTLEGYVSFRFGFSNCYSVGADSFRSFPGGLTPKDLCILQGVLLYTYVESTVAATSSASRRTYD